MDSVPSTKKVKSGSRRGKDPDVIVECGGIEWPVHSKFLRRMSPVFATMMKTAIKEQASARPKIKVDVDVPAQTAGRMIKFLYTGEITAKKVSDDALIDLLHLADTYVIFGLKVMVANCMVDRLSYSNAVRFSTASEQYRGVEVAVNGFMDYCTKNLMKLPKGAELEAFVTKNMKRLFSDSNGVGSTC